MKSISVLVISVLAVGFAHINCSSAALASELTLPDGWVEKQTEGGIQYSDPGGLSLVLDGVTVAPDPTVLTAAKTLDVPGACEGLSAQPVKKTLRGVDKIALTTGNIKCAVYLDITAKPAKLLLTIDQGNGDAIRLAENITSKWGTVAAPITARTQLQNQPTQADGALVQALAAVPKSNRPIGYAQVTSYPMNMNGTMSMEIENWAVFPNGFATDCTGWDPATVNPTPDSLGAMMKQAGVSCDVVSWQRTKENRYRFIAPENVSAPDETGISTENAFAPGTRIDADIGNVRVFGSTGYVPEGMASSRGLSGGQLSMTKAGEIAIGSWSSISIDSAAIVGGSNRKSSPRIGRYYLDGFIIAVQDEQGAISRRFIFGFLDKPNDKVKENAWYLTIDGKAYYPMD